MQRRWLALSITSALAACGPGDDEPAANQPPVAVDDEITVAEDSDTRIDVLANDRDPDGDELQLVRAWSEGPHQVTLEEGRMRLVPAVNFHGDLEIAYRVNDGAAAAEGAVRVTVTPVNDVPTATSFGVATGRNASVAVSLAGSDADGDALAFEVVNAPASGTISGTAPELRYTPAANFAGTDTFTYRARDASAASEPATITITVVPGAAPVAQAQTVETAEDTPKAITLAATDVDGDALTFAIAQQPAHGTLSGLTPDVTYTPEPDWNGSDVFTFTAIDGLLTSAPATVAITVTPVDDPPGNVAPVAQAQTVVTAANTPATITLAATDADGDGLTYAIASQPAHGALTGTPPDVTYTPAAGYSGADAFTFTANDGQLASASAIVAITVTAPGNDPPIAHAQTVATVQGTPKAITLAATDPEGDPLTFAIAQPPAHGTLTGTPPNLTYTPAAGFHGADAFTFTANDGQVASAPATVAITVTAPPNETPVAQAQAVATPESTPKAIALAATDADGDALTFAITQAPFHGTLVGTPPNVTYTPVAGFRGADVFTFTASDGVATSAPANVTITVTPPGNSPPVAQAQTVATAEDTAKTITLAATDVNSNPLTFAIAQQPAHGVLTGTAPNLTYTPAANYFGSDAFTFTANDGQVDSAPATVAITVTPVNDPPVAMAQTITTMEDMAVPVVLSGSDIDDQALTFTIFGQPTRGTLSGAGANLVYTPGANLNGTDTFTFRASDGQTVSAVATVTINVAPMQDPPTANGRSYIADEDLPLTIVLTGGDLDGDALTFTVASEPAHGTVTGTPPSLTYISSANYNGNDAFTFTVSDGQATTAPATISVQVRPRDDLPVITGGSLTVAEGATVAIPLAATDIDGDPLTYTFSDLGPYGQITGTGVTRRYGACCDYNGPATFTVVARDQLHASAPVTYSVTVTPVPDAPIAQPDVGIATPGQSLELDVLVNDSDVDGDELVIQSVSTPSHGTAATDGDVITFLGAPGNTAPATFTYTVVDAAGLTATATVTVGIGRFPTGLALARVAVAVPAAVPYDLIRQQAISADGRYIAFTTLNQHTGADTNQLADVYVWDRVTDTRERISVPVDGAATNGESERPSISDDGRYIAFASAASNLVASDTNGSVDVFVRDRVAGTTTRVSVSASGAQVAGDSRDPELSADGSVVAFTSVAFELVPDDANGRVDVFVRDLTASATTRVSVRTGGGEADLPSDMPAVSGDGRFVAFVSQSTNLVAGDANAKRDVFVHDRTSGVTERVSVSSTGGEVNGHNYYPALSFDGRFVALRSDSSNIVPGATGSATYVRDRQAQTTTQVFGAASESTISGDGRYVAACIGNGHCMIRDRFAAQTFHLSYDTGNDLFEPIMSRDGRYVTVLSNHDLDGQQGANATRVWVYPNPL